MRKIGKKAANFLSLRLEVSSTKWTLGIRPQQQKELGVCYQQGKKKSQCCGRHKIAVDPQKTTKSKTRSNETKQKINLAIKQGRSSSGDICGVILTASTQLSNHLYLEALVLSYQQCLTTYPLLSNLVLLTRKLKLVTEITDRQRKGLQVQPRC